VIRGSGLTIIQLELELELELTNKQKSKRYLLRKWCRTETMGTAHENPA